MAKAPERQPHFYYRSLSLSNFRGFKSLSRMPMAPLTFLVGPNSSGKSSIFDALLFIAQSGFAPESSGQQFPNWVGPLVDLGSFIDTVFGHKSMLKINIEVEASVDLSALPWRIPSKGRQEIRTMRVGYTISGAKKDPVGKLALMQIADPLTGEKIRFSHTPTHLRMRIGTRTLRWTWRETHRRPELPRWIASKITEELQKLPRKELRRRAALKGLRQFIGSYSFNWLLARSQRVSSGRLAPKRWYPVTEIRSLQTRGMVMEPELFEGVDPDLLMEELRESTTRGRTQGLRRRHALTAVLNELEIASKIEKSRFSPYHSAIRVKDSVTGIWSNLIDVGYGASQVIPVLQAGMSSVEGPLFVEQPEIHLHPRAQGTVAELLCETSRDRQVVIETHSADMINRARILVAEGRLKHENVIVNFVKRTRTGSHVFTIPIRPNGEFGANWPQGFFDERYEDTMRLLSLKDSHKRK